tara:strand:- start:851 stop:1003 length:153 start_codon:yes stop_codon:yes gene_type:complete
MPLRREDPSPASEFMRTRKDASLSYTGVTRREARKVVLATVSEVREKRRR